MRRQPLAFPVSHIPASSGVYRIVHEKTGDTYIGSSINMRRRVRGIASSLRSRVNTQKRMRDLVAVHGLDGFRCEVIEEAQPSAALCEREEHWIQTLNPTLNILQTVPFMVRGAKQRKLAP